MTQRFEGTRVLITGASSGIGRATAEAFGREGARVAANYHAERDEAEQVVAEIEAAGGAARALQADVSKEEDVERMFAAAVGEFGGLDVVVVNAGIQVDRPIVEMTLDDWDKVIAVNLTGAFLTARSAVRAFERQAPPAEQRESCVGVLIFITSVHELIPWSKRANYTASKGGEKLLMQSLAQELAPRKIRVNGIAPGAIKTAINEQAWRDPETSKAMLGQIPYGRIGEPADIARAVLWLASPDSDYVVGASLFVDGGMSLYPSFMEG